MSRSNLVRLVLWMSGALVSFCAMAVAVRMLATNLTVFEILATRSGFGVAVLGAVLAFSPALRIAVVPRRMGLHLMRNTAHYIGQYMWALSVTLLPFATVFALEFTMPAWTMLLAALVLGERMTPSRIGAVVLGFAGVLIVLRPGIAAFEPATLLVLAAAALYAVSMVNTKQLSRTELAFTIIFWMNVMQLPMSLAGSSFDFPARLTASDILPILALGISGVSSHYCLSNAMRAADASVVVPLDFLRLPAIAVVGWWLYAESIDMFVIAGALIIFAGVVWNLREETRPVLRTTKRRPAA